MDLTQLKDEIQKTMVEIKASVDKRDAEIEKHGKATEETGKAIDAATRRLDDIKQDLDRAVEDKKAMDDRIAELEKKAGKPDYGDGPADMSIGKMFVESDAYKSAVKKGDRRIDTVSIKKDISTGTASAGYLIRPDRRPEVYMEPERPRFVRELIPSIPTASNAVEVMRELVFTNSAGMQSAELQAKAKSNLTYELVTVNIRTLAHYFVASRQVLSDAPMLQGLINRRGIYGLNLLGDAQILYGTGTGQELPGLMLDSDITDAGGLPLGTATASVPGAMLDQIRKAVTKCQLNEYYNINGLVVNPQDWETIELAKGTDGHYIWVTVPNGGPMQLWRVPVVVTNAMDQYDFLLGDWNMGATIYDREQIDIRIAEQHDDLFVKNGVVVLFEERYGMGIELPKAFCKGSFEVTTT